MSSIEEVALRAKVSVATVSRVINKKTNVSEATRQKVLEAIELLKYQPNALGVLLRKEFTNKVLVLLNSVDNPFFSDIVKGIESVALEHDYTVLISTTYGDKEREKKYLELLQHHYVDGALLITNTLSRKDIDDLNDQYPIAQILEYVNDSKAVHFSIDFYALSVEILEDLIQKGKRNIYFVHSGLIDIISTQQKYQAYIDTLEKHQLPILTKTLDAYEFGIEAGKEIAQKTLKNQAIDAFFVSSDLTALGVLEEVKKRHYRVPEEIAITGFDNTIFSQLSEPALSSVEVNGFRLGYEGMHYILRRLKKEKTELEESKLLETNYIIRETS